MNKLKLKLNKEIEIIGQGKEEFLKPKVFFGLKNLNNGFDSEFT
ncbi:hypothetical protein T190820D02B_20103 [Tenacibaculum sp. 190524A05c]